MKPVYEEVKVKDIQVGDIVKYGVWPPGEWKQWNADDFRRHCLENATLVRQLPPERNPEVLGLVIKKLHNACGILADTANCNGSLKDIDTLIRNAIRELESEAGK